MPAQVHLTASSLKSLHLLRVLLREATYLPDANARRYFRRYIVHRFRAYQPAHHATSSIGVQALERYRHRSCRRRPGPVIQERTRALQRQAHKALNYLRRAVQGEQPCLEKVLLLTYGRIGRRKHALLDELLKPDLVRQDVVAVEEDLSPLQKLYHSNRRFLSFFDAPKQVSNTHNRIEISDRYARLKTVVKSQCQTGISIQRDIKRPFVSVPIHNVWQRPMPIKRARNNVKSWYANTMTRLLPPLPNEEWDQIQAMISGERWISFTKRRIAATQLHPQPTQQDRRFEKVIGEAIAMDRPSKADRPWGMQRPHAITVRYMKRLYTKILALSCKLDWDDQRGKWNIVWGHPLKGIHPQTYSVPVDCSLFAGVDSKGQLIREQKPKPLSSPHMEKGQLSAKIPFFADHLPLGHPLRQRLDEFRKQRDAQSATTGGNPNASLPVGIGRIQP